MKPQKNTPEFLAGGGEMGELMRNLTWSKTPLGPVDKWPQSLKTLLSLLLNSKFPMFLWWGPDLTCFYNDAYRPSLGENGKHPSILGSPAKEAWAEIWHVIGPLIESVLATGEAVWFEDQLVPIYRNGRIEDVYWTFSYSPVVDDSGKRAGVFVTCTETTGKVRLFKELEESNKGFANTILQAPVAMCILIGPHFIVELANEKMFELWGRTPAEMMNKPLFEGVYEARNHGFEELIDSVYRTGETISRQSVATTFLRKGNLERGYVDVIYHPYSDTNGTITGVLAVATDTTVQVLAHKRIEEAEEKTRIALNSAELGMYEIIYATNEMLTDSRFKEIWDSEGSVSRDKYVAFIHPEDMAIREQAHKESIKSGHLEYRCRIIWKDKSIHWVKITGKVIYDEKGKPGKLIGVIQDITSTVDALKQIEENESRLNIVIGASELGTWELNLKTFEVNYSDRYLEIFGYSGGATINHSQLLKHVHPDDLPGRNKSVEEAIISGTMYYQMRLLTNDGTIRWIETKGKVFYDHANKPDKMMGTIRDITLEKQREFELVESEVILDKLVKDRTIQLERSNEDLQQFAHVASHDLKEPLRKIKMYTNRLEEGYSNILPPKALEFLTQVTGASTRMQMMIDGVLSLSTINTTKEPVEQVNLNDTIDDVKNDLEYIMEQKKATLIVGWLPEIQGAGILFYQLFYNLVNNSLKFSKAGIPPLIKINSAILKKEGNEYVKISVWDNGIGFDQRYAEQIFTTFVRLHSKDKYEGTGLGLSLCKKIVERHGGTIEATGIENDGATFTIILPLIQQNGNI
jgi:PAS domain S-box-containing protein